MKSHLSHEYDVQDIKAILDRAQSILSNGFEEVADKLKHLQLAGTVLHNASALEKYVIEITLARLDAQTIDIDFRENPTFTETESLSHLKMVSSALDLVLASYSDSETFGNGHRFLKQFPDSLSSPLLILNDDLYAPQPALSELLGFRERLGDLSGKRITISWGFGTKFVLPNTAHSLLLQGVKLGANMTVVSPSEFGLLNRVTKDATSIADSTNGSIHLTDDFASCQKGSDAIFVLNWCRFDDFRRPERNAEYAAKFRDWFFTEDELDSDILFSTQPPVETELIASQALIDSERNLTQNWLNRRIAVLAASLSYLLDQ